MGKITFGILGVIAIGAYLLAEIQGSPYRNQFVFEDNSQEVSRKVAEMESLMEKILKTGTHNYFIDNKGYLYLGSEKIAPIKGAINNPEVRTDFTFKNFTDKEFRSFFYLMAYLTKNHISSSYRDKTIGRFVFTYRKIPDESYNDVREIMVVHNEQDTTNSNFKEAYQILDRRENMVLLAPSDAVIR